MKCPQNWHSEIIKQFETGKRSVPRRSEAMYGENDPVGINSLNKAIMDVVNPHVSKQKWKVGDRVELQELWRQDCEWRHGHNYRCGQRRKISEIQPDLARDEGSIISHKPKCYGELKYAWALSA